MALIDKLKAIADAIRSKTGNTEELTLEQMATEIERLSTSGGSSMKEYLTVRASDGYQFYNYKGTYKTLAGFLGYDDTSAVTNMNYMFNSCSNLTTIPQLDTSAVTNMSSMFSNCSDLTTIPQLDTSAVTNMNYMFFNCSNLTTIPQLDTSAVTNMSNMFNSCSNLTTIQQLDTSAVTNMSSMFYYCRAIKDCRLRNIKIDLQVGSGTSYGHLLTLDSLLFMIGELINTGSSKTFTVGSANLEKLADVYVKTVTITDEMRVEDPYIDQKLPFEVCESTDEGDIYLIKEYVNLKNWQLA